MLSEKTVKDAEGCLRDYRRMNFNARREIAFRLRSLIEDQVSPPPADIDCIHGRHCDGRVSMAQATQELADSASSAA